MTEIRKSITLPEDLDKWVSEQAQAQERSWAAQLRYILREAKDKAEAGDASAQ